MCYRRKLPVARGFFDQAASVFEEATALGKGVSYFSIQVALEAPDRGLSSILGTLETKAETANTQSARGLALLVQEVCLALIRKSDDWVSSCSDAKHFAGAQAEGRAETYYNREVFLLY